MSQAVSESSVEMPSNWDDHEGWNRYYSASPAAEKPQIGFSDVFELASA